MVVTLEGSGALLRDPKKAIEPKQVKKTIGNITFLVSGVNTCFMFIRVFGLTKIASKAGVRNQGIGRCIGRCYQVEFCH